MIQKNNVNLPFEKTGSHPVDKRLRKYDIKLFDLDEGANRFDYRLEQDFFDGFGTMEFEKAGIDATVNITKHGQLMEVDLHTRGHVELLDDRTAEPYMQPLSGSIRTVLRFGPEYNDDNDDLILIPFDTPVFNVAQLLYESVLLSIPMKHLDPQRPYEEEDTENEPAHIDPRWMELKKLLNDKNT